MSIVNVNCNNPEFNGKIPLAFCIYLSSFTLKRRTADTQRLFVARRFLTRNWSRCRSDSGVNSVDMGTISLFLTMIALQTRTALERSCTGNLAWNRIFFTELAHGNVARDSLLKTDTFWDVEMSMEAVACALWRTDDKKVSCEEGKDRGHMEKLL